MELGDVLNRPRIRKKYGLTSGDIQTAIGLILLRGEEVSPTRKVFSCRDPSDNMFLKVAAKGQADLIVSGDADLLVLSPFEGIQIVSPSTFLARLDEHS